MKRHEDHPDVQDRGDSLRISFDDKEQVSRAGMNKSRVANLEELKIGFFTYFKEVDPSLLECKVFFYGIGALCTMDSPILPIITTNRTFLGSGEESCSHELCA